MRSPARPLAFLCLFILAFVTRSAMAGESAACAALTVTKGDGTLVQMPLKHTKVNIEVTAFVARATIEQVFANTLQAPVEAVYTFPLGDRAAVDDFELTVGERTIRGEIKRREEARRTYESARAAGYQAALLEQERPNIFMQSVANLEPGKEITVRLRTVETLRYERGSYRLAFPLVVGPRYIPGGSARVPDAARIVSPALRPGTRSGHDVEIRVKIDSGVPLRDLRSTSHRIVTNRLGAASAEVRLADDDTIPNKDFQLTWSVASERPAVGLLAHRDGLDGFFTLLVQPKGEIGATEAMPKEITFVVDTSGSMSGLPIEASKRFIAKALHELGQGDTFNVIRFSGDNEVFSKDPLPNVRAEIERAIAWVNGKHGGGGTEMLSALRVAFARPADPSRLRVIIFFTDGFVGNDDEILREIVTAPGAPRVYTVGVGSSVNRYLLDRMADVGRGAFITIRPDEGTDDALESFRSWVTRPYLTDLTVDWGALPVADVSPEVIRDLGSGQTLTLVGRYITGSAGDVVVRGKLGGRYWEQSVRVIFPERREQHAALASLWARSRIEELLLRSPGSSSDAVRAEVTALALEYRLMSPFTSFVAVDDSRVVNPAGTSPTIHQALPLPDGVSFEGIFGKEDVAEELANVHGARERDFKTLLLASPAPPTSAVPADRNALPAAQGVAKRARLEQRIDASGASTLRTSVRDTAFRVLADLADDGKLSPAEGSPAVAALLAAQDGKGALDDDVATHAIATWALAEAVRAMPKEPSLDAARSKAVDYLVGLRFNFDAEATRWARLVLGKLRPASITGAPVPQGKPSEEYTRRRDAIAGARSGVASNRRAGPGAFDRLVATIGRGHLRI